MKRKIAAILCCAAAVLLAGTSIAYYNTKSFGFDENARVISYDKEKVTFMDFNIYYKDIYNFIDKLSAVIPKESHRITL